MKKVQVMLEFWFYEYGVFRTSNKTLSAIYPYIMIREMQNFKKQIRKTNV